MHISSRNVEKLIKEATKRKLTSGDSRQLVHHLLEKGSDEKMVSSKTEEAIKLLKKAEEICGACSDKISEPWLSVIAYRRAHLLMRLCSSPERIQKSEEISYLEEADALFAKASRRANLLGPLPSIYRLAVLHRIRMLSCDNGNNIDDRITSAYNKAVDRFITWASESPESILGLSRNSAPTIIKSEDSHNKIFRLQLQNGYFNMLELASYFLAQPYGILEGRGILPYKENDIMISGGWAVISPDPETCGLQVSREIAIEEVQEMRMNTPESVVFILSHNKSEEKILKWKYGSGNWERGNYESLRLLALLCAMKDKTAEELRNKFKSGAGSDEPGASDVFRTAKSRLKGRFQKLTRVSPSEIFAEYTPSGIPIVHPGINIYGAVEKKVLDYRHGNASQLY